MFACLFAVLTSGSFARFHCDVFHFFCYTMSSIFFLQAHKQFRYAARFVFTLTATEQLHTQVMSAAYPCRMAEVNRKGTQGSLLAWRAASLLLGRLLLLY